MAPGIASRHRVSPVVNEWGHIAAVSGPDGMKLYYNGKLAGTNDHKGSFATLKGVHNYLGRSNQSPGARGAGGAGR